MSVYFVSDGCGHVKIGTTSGYPENRLQALQGGSARRLEILRVIDGGQKTELWLHRKYKEYRVSGEWFQLVDGMMTVVTPDELPPPPRPPGNECSLEAKLSMNRLNEFKTKLQYDEVMDKLNGGPKGF